MKAVLVFLPLCLSACMHMDYLATAPGGATEHINLSSFGGSQTLDSAGGTRYTSNHVKTAGQFFQTVAAGLTGYFNHANLVAGEATTRLKDTNKTNLGVVNSNNKAATDQLNITTNGATEVAKLQKP